MDDKKQFTCIVCPRGCSLEVSATDGRVSGVSGYSCNRGNKYAVDEYTNPVRTCTTTVRVKDGKLPVAPVKTSCPIPKQLVVECVKKVNQHMMKAPVKIGSVVMQNVCGTGADIVVTADVGMR